MINQQIQNYRIISLLGEGGMGNVYLGKHVSIKRKVAIKVLKPELAKNDEIRKRFKNEASMLAHLQHPNIVGLIDYVEQEDGLYLIMEYIDGQGLDELIKAQHMPINIERAKKLMIQILQAFFYAHTNGVVHRDVKPSNILVTADDQIKVLDFGIAKLVGDSQHHLTKTGTQIGTVYYMSPEQVKGKELDHRSDIYSLGVTFYELLSGVCPYRGMTTEYEIYDSIVKEPLKSLVQTMGADYGDVWGVIANATQKDPLQRIKSCEEFIQCLVNESKHQYSEILDSSNINAKRGLPNKVVLLSILGSMCILLAIGLVFLIGGNVSSSGDQKELSNIQNDSESNISESYPIVKDKNELKNIHEPIPISQSNDVTTSIDKTSELKSEKVLEKKSLQAEVAVYEYVDNVPEFPGGSSALMSFIQKNVIYPQNAIEKNIQGRCYVKFIVKEDGSLSDITVERTILGCPECDKEAIRVVKMMPKWKPGMVKGKCVSSVMRLPFNFALQ